MIRELDIVALNHDLPEHGLEQGAVGTVVHVHSRSGYMIEFMDAEGETMAVISLDPSDVRPVDAHESDQARPLERRP